MDNKQILLRIFKCKNPSWHRVRCRKKPKDRFYDLRTPAGKLIEFLNTYSESDQLKVYFCELDEYGLPIARYHTQKDVIRLTDPSYFVDNVQAVAFFAHECGHSTGHGIRLGRPLDFEKNERYSKNYLLEEILAEAVSLKLKIRFNFEPKYIKTSIQYLARCVFSVEISLEELCAALDDADRAIEYIDRVVSMGLTENTPQQLSPANSYTDCRQNVG